MFKTISANNEEHLFQTLRKSEVINKLNHTPIFVIQRQYEFQEWLRLANYFYYKPDTPMYDVKWLEFDIKLFVVFAAFVGPVQYTTRESRNACF